MSEQKSPTDDDVAKAAVAQTILRPTNSWAAADVPPEWQPANNIDLVRDDDAHMVWIALLPDGPTVTRGTLRRGWPYRVHVKVDVDAALARLQRYGLLTIVGAAHEVAFTEKGTEWAAETAGGAYAAGFVPDVPAWLRERVGLDVAVRA